MPLDWQKLQGGPGFKGLLRRRQMQVDDLAYFQVLQNVDGYGGSLAKRPGTQFVNGWGTYTNVISPAGQRYVNVADGSGFATGQVVYVGETAYVVTGAGSDYVQINTNLPSDLGVGAPIIQVFPATGPIQTLFQAVYRNTHKYLYAAVNCRPMIVKAGQPLTPALLTTPSISTVSGVPSPTTAYVNCVDGVQVGDWISIGNTPSYSVQVTQVSTSPQKLVWDPPIPGTLGPPLGTIIVLGPIRTQQSVPPPEMVQYSNQTFLTAGLQSDGATPPHFWSTAPMVIRETTTAGPVGHRCGLKPPVTPLQSTIAGTIAVPGMTNGGNYGYRARYYNSTTGQESEGGPELSVNLSTGNAVMITIYGSPDSQCDQIHLYRTSFNGGGAWYRVLQVRYPGGFSGNYTSIIPNPGAATTVAVVDDTPDPSLGSQMRDLLDACIPDSVSLLAIWGQANRLIGIDLVQNSVFYSDQPDLRTGALKGESWPVNNQIFVSYDDGDQLTGLASFFDSVLVFKNHSIWRITGVPPNITIEPLHFRQDQTATGCGSQRQILVDHDDVIYRGMDAIYELNRYQGQAQGFQSQRLSLPIDEALQQGFDIGNEEPVGHGVYFRYKRQVRFFETTQDCFVLQFESDVVGNPLGWSTWLMTMPDVAPMPFAPAGPRCSCVAIYDPTVFRGWASPFLGPTVEAAVFIAIDGGLVLQMDIGTCDYGFNPYEVLISPPQVAPAGRGLGARGRAIDFQVQQINAAMPTFEFLTDWMVQTGDYPSDAVIIPFALVDGLNVSMGANQIDLIGVPLPAFDNVSVLCIAPGHLHQWFFRENSVSSYYRIMGWTYWFQALATQAVWRQNVATQPANIMRVPNP